MRGRGMRRLVSPLLRSAFTRFGTENCCIYLDDATMLEPLAIGHRETCEAAVLEGNTFVRNDQTYRFSRGDDGFSHLVIKSDDAAADDAIYRKYAMSGGPVVDFSRAFETPDGNVRRNVRPSRFRR